MKLQQHPHARNPPLRTSVRSRGVLSAYSSGKSARELPARGNRSLHVPQPVHFTQKTGVLMFSHRFQWSRVRSRAHIGEAQTFWMLMQREMNGKMKSLCAAAHGITTHCYTQWKRLIYLRWLARGSYITSRMNCDIWIYNNSILKFHGEERRSLKAVNLYEPNTALRLCKQSTFVFLCVECSRRLIEFSYTILGCSEAAGFHLQLQDDIDSYNEMNKQIISFLVFMH